MKIVSIVGARPQFIKAAALSRLLKEHELMIHTGQHYDDNMSAVFFDELGIPTPHINLGVGSGRHGTQTAAMLAGIEEVLLSERPDWLLVYGDTNSTLAGALAASKLHIPIAHVEAGLRSFNRAMPEEVNRVVTDHLSSLLFCPSQTAVDNLMAEGIKNGVHLVGDVMVDALMFAKEKANSRLGLLKQLGVKEGGYLLATVHRAENTNDRMRLLNILTSFDELQEPIIFPIHPRTQKAIQKLNYSPASHVQLIEPVGYLDMVMLEKSARMILTDSGGIQKEAYWLGIPCLTLRDETEWVETVQMGWNVLVGADKTRIMDMVPSFVPPASHPVLYGQDVAQQIVKSMLDSYTS